MWCWNGMFGMYGNGMFVILVNIYFVEFISVSHNVMATDIVFPRDNPQPLISFTSIRSSPSSIYRNYDFHLNLVKMTGTVVFLSIKSATLILTNSVYEMEKSLQQVWLHPADIPNTDISIWWTMEQHIVWLHERISTSRRILCYCVCLPDGSENWFWGHIQEKLTTTHKTELYLNLRQWNYLKRFQNHIDLSIENAMNWRTAINATCTYYRW